MGEKRGKIDIFFKLIAKDNLEWTKTDWMIDDLIKLNLNSRIYYNAFIRIDVS